MAEIFEINDPLYINNIYKILYRLIYKKSIKAFHAYFLNIAHQKILFFIKY